MPDLMALALYTVAVSAVYALIALASEPAAHALVILFVALLIIPHVLIRRHR